MSTENDEMAQSTGQEKSDHEPICTYDSKKGRYTDLKPAVTAGSQVKSTVSPFGSLK